MIFLSPTSTPKQYFSEISQTLIEFVKLYNYLLIEKFEAGFQSQQECFYGKKPIKSLIEAWK